MGGKKAEAALANMATQRACVTCATYSVRCASHRACACTCIVTLYTQALCAANISVLVRTTWQHWHCWHHGYSNSLLYHRANMANTLRPKTTNVFPFASIGTRCTAFVTLWKIRTLYQKSHRVRVSTGLRANSHDDC